jgi:DMSO/TMAO reductase YedYZ molybdopterin-dependent catalytic subunit
MAEDDVTLTGAVKDKLIASKEKWAREGRLLTGAAGQDRLPPGQRLVTDFPVLDLGVQPEVKLDRWRLRVEGLVGNKLALDWDAFQGLPQREWKNDIHCVTAWSRYDNIWHGVAARDLLELARPKPEARFIVFHSYDGYTTNVPLEVFAAEDALVGAQLEQCAAGAHPWRPRPHRHPALLLLEERQMGDAHRAARRGSARLLGGARLSQQRRSLAGGTLWLSAVR